MAVRAMTWIPLHASAFSDPKITRAADQLTNGDVEKMVGYLARLWTWALDHAESGDLAHLRPSAIANAAGWNASARRFVNVLLSVGLFDSGPKIHEFARYSGGLIARRTKDRERKAAMRQGEEEARSRESSAWTSAGSPRGRPQEVQGVDDSDRTETAIAIDDVVVIAHAVGGTDVSVADGPRSSEREGRSEEAVETNVERALDVLRRVRWYPLNESQDRPLLQEVAAHAPQQDLAADVGRWAKKVKGTVERPRASLEGWLKKFGSQDRPVDRPPSGGEALAELAYNANPTAETLRALRTARGPA